MYSNNQTKLQNIFSKKFLLNFENFYTGKKKIILHIVFWLSLLSFYLLDHLIVGGDFPIILIIAIILRQIIPSIIFFYFTSYYIVPHLFFRKKFFLTIICLAIPFLIAPTINFLAFHIFYKPFIQDQVSEMDISLGLFIRDFREVINPDYIILGVIPIFLRTLPAFMFKLLVSTIHIFSKDAKNKTEAHKLEMENIQLEVNFLKSQLNPHYLFNALNNIYSYAYFKDDRAPEMISDLSEILQYTLYESKNVLAPLDREIRFLENYLNMERMRYEDVNSQIEFHQKVRPGTDIMIAPLILFPFIENAVKYGIKENKNAGWVKVNLELAEDEMIFSVENNISSANNNNESRKNRLGGIGISSTKRRLEMLYPDHQLTIKNTEDSYSVFLKIKCLYHEPKTEMHHR